MNIVRKLLLLCTIALSLTTTAYSFQVDTSTCIRVVDYEVECLGYDNNGNMRYEVSFKFSNVRPGTNFIRVYQDNGRGATHTFPFKAARQLAVFVNCGCCEWESLTIDVYDVLPNGKVVMCRVQTEVFLCCDGYYDGFGKDVVAGGSDFTAPAVSLAPNPASEAVQVNLSVPSFDPNSSLDIIDINGNVVVTVAKGMNKGLTVLAAELYNLPVGTYMVRMLHSGGTIVTPLQVIR